MPCLWPAEVWDGHFSSLGTLGAWGGGVPIEPPKALGGGVRE